MYENLPSSEIGEQFIPELASAGTGQVLQAMQRPVQNLRLTLTLAPNRTGIHGDGHSMMARRAAPEHSRGEVTGKSVHSKQMNLQGHRIAGIRPFTANRDWA
jgi:hypothetical protein